VPVVLQTDATLEPHVGDRVVHRSGLQDPFPVARVESNGLGGFDIWLDVLPGRDPFGPFPAASYTTA